jgi:hypothetical protein
MEAEKDRASMRMITLAPRPLRRPSPPYGGLHVVCLTARDAGEHVSGSGILDLDLLSLPTHPDPPGELVEHG